MEANLVMAPRETFAFEHGAGLDNAFREACDRGRLHHAWLLSGPQGVGKASFAYRCARFLMGRDRDGGAGALGMSPDDADVRLIAAQSHPDLLVLEKEPGKKNIAVEAVREVGEFFSKAPSRSPWRVCIIDAVDDMNINSANALLKILEEPPHKGILFLVSHSAGRLLPTIRSRCRRLVFTPWSDSQVDRFLAQRLSIEADQKARLVRLARGAPGRAISLATQGAVELDLLAESLLASPIPPRHEMLQAAAMFKSSSAKSDGAGKFATFVACLADRIHDLVLSAETPQTAQKLAKLWDRLNNALAEVEMINLDRGDYFWSIYNDLLAIR